MPMVTLFALALLAPQTAEIRPMATEIVNPIRNATFNKDGKAKKRVQGGNPRLIDGHLVFDGSTDGDRQVDPQIAVGGGFILHGTNSGLVIYDKNGNYIDGVPQSEFNNGIDPKLFYDPHNKVFGFDMWVYWDKEKVKPVNVSVSESADPRKGWNTYPVSAKDGWDGGAIGYSRKWIGYSFPGGESQTFVMRMSEAKAGKPATIFRFKGSLGSPSYTQDATDDLVFVELTDNDIIMRTVGESKAKDGVPVVKKIVRVPHHFKYFGWPPNSPMKGTDKLTASGDRNPKNLVVQSKCLWFSQAVDVNGRAGVQWHQVRLSDGKFIQSGLLSHPVNSYIETSIAVNKRNDVLVGFQETGPGMFISGRCAWRKASDPLGTLGPILRLGEGQAATAGGPWGDYSGSVFDGDNKIDLWTIQSIANAKGGGSTAIAQIKL